MIASTIGGANPSLNAAASAEVETFGSFRLRAIGGRPLADARLFRSGELAALAPAEALAITRTFGIASVFDVRNEWEVAASPEPYLIGAKTVRLSPSTERRRKQANRRLAAGVIEEYGAPEARMKRNYRRYVNEYPLLGRAMRTMAAEQVPALVHCVNGKDRTGVFSAVIMRACGEHRDDVMHDYLLSNQVNAESIQREADELGQGMTPRERAILMSFLEARPAYLQAFFDELEDRFGTFDAYLAEGVRLTPAQRDGLAALYAG